MTVTRKIYPFTYLLTTTYQLPTTNYELRRLTELLTTDN